MKIKITNLSESFQGLEGDISDKPKTIEVKQQFIEDVFNFDLNQFKFESGLFMSIKSKDMEDMKFSLEYHKKHTKDVDEFVKSVGKFISAAGIVLIGKDVSNLKRVYGKIN